jgi:hypothetical protein
MDVGGFIRVAPEDERAREKAFFGGMASVLSALMSDSSLEAVACWGSRVGVRVSHISPKTGEIWGTLWSVTREIFQKIGLRVCARTRTSGAKERKTDLLHFGV